MSSIPEIFFSYAWSDENEQGGSREKIVDELYESLLKDNYPVIRDKYNLEYKGFITDFMAGIGKGRCIVVAISQKYVKSPYCMFELYEIARNSNFDKLQFREKVLPVMVDFVDFTNPAVIEDHLTFWDHEYKKWDDLVKKRAGQLSVEQMLRYDKIKMIYQNFGRLTEWIIDMNTLNPQVLSKDNFAEIKKAIAQIGGTNRNNKDVPAIPLIKTPVFRLLAVAILAVTIFTVSWMTKKHNGPVLLAQYGQPAFSPFGNAGEQLLIIQDLKTKRFGYARSKDTSLFISCKYDEANSFKERIALVKMNGKYQWIKADSTVAFPGQYDYAEEFENGKARVVNRVDTFYINNKGKRWNLPVITTKKGIQHLNIAVAQSKDSIEKPVIQMCQAVCYTNGVSGIEVSFLAPDGSGEYKKTSNENDLVFDIPCNFLGKTVSITFKKNDKSEYRKMRLKDLQVPDLFKTN